MTMSPVGNDFTFDLDAEREQRQQQREVKVTSVPVRLGGAVVAHVPPELPLPALAPLRKIDTEITLLLRTIMDAMNSSGGAQAQLNATELVVDLLAANPNLPSTLIDVVHDIGLEMFGEDGLERFIAARPSVQDVIYLARGLMSFYGFQLGESQPSSTSLTETEQDGQADALSAGETSKPTSPTTTPDSTSEASGPTPETPASSAPAAS